MKRSVTSISLPIAMAFLAVALGSLFVPSVSRIFPAFEGTFAVVGGIWLVLWAMVKFAITPQGFSFSKRLRADEMGQDIAEYAVMLAVILVIVISTVKLIGGNANNVFSQVGSSLSQPADSK